MRTNIIRLCCINRVERLADGFLERLLPDVCVQAPPVSGRDHPALRPLVLPLRYQRIAKLADAWLPKPRILHPWPSDRFAVKHPRWEPYARIGHVRICAGGAQ